MFLGIGKLTSADTKALADPEVLKRLTQSVSSALDEAALALQYIKSDQQKSSANNLPAKGWAKLSLWIRIFYINT